MSLPRPLPRRAVYGACDDVRRPVGNHRMRPGSEVARRTARPHGGRRGPRRAHRCAARSGRPRTDRQDPPLPARARRRGCRTRSGSTTFAQNRRRGHLGHARARRDEHARGRARRRAADPRSRMGRRDRPAPRRLERPALRPSAHVERSRRHRRAAAQPAQSAARARVDHARVPRRAHVRLRRIGRHGATLPRTSRRSRRAGPGAHHPGALRHASGRDARPGLVRRRQGRLSDRSWDELAFAPALELAARVRARELSSVELVELYLDRIAQLDPELNAYVTVDADGALAAARAADAAEPESPFHGVPIPIKDLNETARLRTTYSTKAYANNVPQIDAAVVRRIREAGFVVLGKTNTPELGTIAMTESELNGVCRNPWDTSRTPGGSSGGAAAATAAGLRPIAHGTDGGGSIRIPASCCGLFGLKPSRGRVSPAPYGSGTLGLSTSGPIARTVRDAAALLDAMAGTETGDAYFAPEPEQPFLVEASSAPGALRIAVTTTPPVDVPVDPECVAAVRSAAELLTELGHDVRDATPAWTFDELVPSFVRIWQVGPATAGIADLALLEPINRMLAEQARATSSPEHVLAIMELQRVSRQVIAFWNDVDVLLTPTLALPPVPVGWTFEETGGDAALAFSRQWLFTPFTAVFNVTGQPAMSVPLHTSETGLPIGVQFVARPYAEATLLRLAAQLEEARPWAGR